MAALRSRLASPGRNWYLNWCRVYEGAMLPVTLLRHGSIP